MQFIFKKKLYIQGEHKLFPRLQTLITKNLRGIAKGGHVEAH
jgi:hypothetical protein